MAGALFTDEQLEAIERQEPALGVGGGGAT